MKESNIAFEKPVALETLSEDIFLELPLYKTKKPYGVYYVNTELFKDFFDSNTNFEYMAKVISEYFSTTLDIKKSNGTKMTNAYVDMQAAPFAYDLKGNKGSGRAFYQGRNFNIKGEKTPLATSTVKDYSTGVLELEKAIYETVISNSLYKDTNINVSPVLAVLDVGENCKVSWKKQSCRKAKIIRVDLNGTLNRMSHIFKMKKLLSRKELFAFTDKVAKMEGEKFIQRILHGAWSAGNLSPNSDMIDFDSVCATKYRCPLYSVTPYRTSNYFGFEYLGQLVLLKSLADDKVINKDNVEYSELKKELLSKKDEYIISNFPRLMGFEVFSNLPQNTEKLLKLTVKMFNKLSRKCYALHKGLSAKNLNLFEYSPFDFSNFFRMYPMLKLYEKDYKVLIKYLIGFMADIKEFKLEDYSQETPDDRYFFKHAVCFLDKCYIHSEKELVSMLEECMDFIKNYEKLFNAFLNYSQKPISKIALDAYIFNEDRGRMMFPYSIAGPIDDNKKKWSKYHINNIIDTVIRSNKRSGSNKIGGLNACNIEIYYEGFFATLLDNNLQHRISLNLYDEFLKYNKDDVYTVNINNVKYPCKIVKEGNIYSIQGPFLPNSYLLKDKYEKIIFFKNGKKISLKNFKFIYTTQDKVFDFSCNM